MRPFAFVVGLVIVGATAMSVFTTLVLPRSTSSRLLRSIAGGLGNMFRRMLPVLGSYEARDRLMAVVGPFAMVLLFMVWLALLVVGFGLIEWWVISEPLLHAFAVSGSSVFTLGFATTTRAGSDPIEFIAAGMGLLVIALEIAYLPTLYSAFSARETTVTMLASRAGLPAWGPEVLARHHWFKIDDELPGLYAQWEEWAAGVAESHSSYPTLMWFRSPMPLRSWILALTAMLDAAALHDAINPSTCPREARVLLAMGRDCVRALARALRLPHETDPRPDRGIRLTFAEFEEGFRRLEEVGYSSERSLPDAWRHFQGWRVNYEEIIDRLTELVLPPPAPWLVEHPELGEARWPHILDRTPDEPEPEESFRRRIGLQEEDDGQGDTRAPAND